MHLRNLALLALLVGALALLAWWQVRREAAAPAEERALIEAFDPAQLSGIRIDHLDRGLQMKIERDQRGRWRIVDPIDFPAEPALVGFLLDTLREAKARRLPEPVEARKVGLEPPRIVLELVGPSGAADPASRLEIGLADLEGSQVFARTGGPRGEIVRTTRSLATTLDRDLHEWRESRVLDLAPESLVELHRQGAVYLEGNEAPVDMELDAINEGGWEGGWRMTRPYVARLDPIAFQSLVQAALFLRARDFVPAGAVLETFGLDQPELRLELVTASGEGEVLSFARKPGEAGEWYGVRSSNNQVFVVERESILWLVAPPERLLDRQVVRLLRERIERVNLVSERGEVHLARKGAAWTVSEAGALPRPADPERVGDLLGAIEGARILEFLPGHSLDGAQGQASIRVEAGEPQGGRFGGEVALEGGGRGVLFMREGDQLAGAVDPSFAALARTPASALQSLELHRLKEIEVGRVQLGFGGEVRTFVRDGNTGRWSREGSEAEAKGFAALVDALLLVRAEEHLEADAPPALEDPVAVTILDYAGRTTGFTLGRRSAADGEAEQVVYLASDGSAARVSPELHRRLVELLRGPR
jgi:hypothetical protein